MTKLKTTDKLLAGFVLIFIILMSYLWFSPSGLKVVPSVELTTISGKKLNLDSLRGKPVLVTFWATSCSGCIKEMPHLIDLHNQYASQGLTIIGISMPYDRPDHVMEMAKQKQLPYIVAMDINKQATKAFGDIKLTPTTFLIDKRGTIVRHKIGELNMELVEQQIKTLLASTTINNLQPANAVKKLN